MAIGDTDNVIQRLRSVLPPWFPDPTKAPILTAILSGTADGFSFVFSYLQYAKLQTRIKSATGGWLDLIAWDYFGSRFRRRSGEADGVFKPRLLAELTRPRATRSAIIQAVQDLTGVAPLVFEPWNPADCGGYGIGTSGYGVAGCYGSLSFPNQLFITAVLAGGQGVPDIGGYGAGPIGYGVAGEYIDNNQITGAVTDADIYSTVAQTIAAGVTAWVDIVGALPSHVDPFPYPVTADGDVPSADSGTITVDHI